MAGRKLAPRGRANGAGRSRTGYSRTLTAILSELASSGMQFRELDGAPLLNVPLITCEAVEGVEIRQPSNREVRRSSCIGLAQLWQRGGLGAVLLAYLPSMTRSPTCHSDVVLEHYRRVAGSLTFGKTSLTANGHLKPGPGRLPATLARIEAGQQFE
jgi:hypothetical protein